MHYNRCFDIWHNLLTRHIMELKYWYDYGSFGLHQHIVQVFLHIQFIRCRCTSCNNEYFDIVSTPKTRTTTCLGLSDSKICVIQEYNVVLLWNIGMIAGLTWLQCISPCPRHEYQPNCVVRKKCFLSKE